jgi:hypothetical protein
VVENVNSNYTIQHDKDVTTKNYREKEEVRKGENSYSSYSINLGTYATARNYRDETG